MALDFSSLRNNVVFNRAAVLELAYGRTAGMMKQFGGLVRIIARRSMKRRKKASLPGQPPSAHKGALKDLMAFHYSPEEANVVIGPLPLPGAAYGVVPGRLEYGAMIPSRKNSRRTLRRLGGGGEVRIGGPSCKTTKRNQEGKLVTYAKLKTASQVVRANEINHELYGPAVAPAFELKKRPYMEPAFTIAKKQVELPSMWKAA